MELVKTVMTIQDQMVPSIKSACQILVMNAKKLLRMVLVRTVGIMKGNKVKMGMSVGQMNVKTVKDLV